jgi:uncharacterized protein
MAEPVRVLSIDGGGIRGIVPAMILAEIERQTGKRIWELFSLLAGSSTGGIIALALTKPLDGGKPYTAADLVGLYEQEGEHIFSAPTWHRMRAVGNVFEEKYPSRGVEDVLDRYFGESRLKDALADVLISSYEIERRLPWFFRSSRARTNPDYDFPMKQVARATSAAPTYFEPLKIDVKSNNTEDYYALIDGGVYANNPALCAYVEAISTHGRRDPSDFLVVSLGTGQLTRRLPYDEAKDWGLARWAQPILSVVFDGVSDTVDYQMRQLLTCDDPHDHYYRFQTTLNAGNDDMDDATRTNIRVLKLLAEEIIRDHGKELSALCTQLTESTPARTVEPEKSPLPPPPGIAGKPS